MGRFRLVSAGAVFACVVGFSATSSRAGFASAVLNYSAGTGIGATYQDPASALGMPHADTSFGVLTPFNGAFLGSHIVGIGAGGSLALRLADTAPTGAGATIGVHASVTFVDTAWPNGQAAAPVTLVNNPRVADVFVSDDGLRWHALGGRTFDIPTNFYSQGVTTPGFQEQPGTQVADFTKPFPRDLSDFDGRNWSSMLALLDGSAGGEWLDLTDVPYPGVNYVRFDVTEPGQSMYVDAVAVVPEPTAFVAVVTVAGAVLARRR
jgi:hypothetical protein